jgi:hypothetical protein
MKWIWLSSNSSQAKYTEADCAKCHKRSLWKVLETTTDENNFVIAKVGQMLFPDHGFAPPPHDQMPASIQKDYLEAAKIAGHSPRGSAALLRLCLQKLCKHLNEPGLNINQDIRSLAKKGTIPTQTIEIADTIRLVGNAAVHPGIMLDEDIDYVAEKMFKLINVLIEKSIAEPKLLKELYEKTPEELRKAAEKSDNPKKK